MRNETGSRYSRNHAFCLPVSVTKLIAYKLFNSNKHNKQESVCGCVGVRTGVTSRKSRAELTGCLPAWVGGCHSVIPMATATKMDNEH